MSETWTLRLADHVDSDLHDIVVWTTGNFGARQANEYLETVTLAIEALCDEPTIVGAKVRDDIGFGIRTLHMARLGRKGRHFIVFKVEEEQTTIDVLRILHDSMDLVKHLPDAG